jgi:general stress protein YciG
LMSRCQGIKRDGGRCTASVPPGVQWCFNHDPERAADRKRNASRAGKSSGGREIRDLKRRISDVVDAVLEGSQDRGRAAVAIQGLNALRGVLELERKIRELDELEARIEALEQTREGGRAWGA